MKAVGPLIDAACPDVKLFGAQHMLSADMNDGKSLFHWIYKSKVQCDPDVLRHWNIWAYHGYSDGVNPIPGSEMAQLWSLVLDSLQPSGPKERISGPK